MTAPTVYWTLKWPDRLASLCWREVDTNDDWTGPWPPPELTDPGEMPTGARRRAS